MKKDNRFCQALDILFVQPAVWAEHRLYRDRLPVLIPSSAAQHIRASWPADLRGTVLPAGAVACGYLVGRAPLGFTECLRTLSVASLLAILALGYGSRAALKQGHGASVVLALYIVILVLSEPFVFIGGDVAGVVGAIALLLPVVVGLIIWLREEAWCPAAGAWLVLFAGVASLTFNVSHWGAGLGFYSGWLS